MTKKKAFREPETVKAYYWDFGQLSMNVFETPITDKIKPLTMKVRIIREKDYQRLLKAAREKKS